MSIHHLLICRRVLLFVVKSRVLLITIIFYSAFSFGNQQSNSKINAHDYSKKALDKIQSNFKGFEFSQGRIPRERAFNVEIEIIEKRKIFCEQFLSDLRFTRSVHVVAPVFQTDNYLDPYIQKYDAMTEKPLRDYEYGRGRTRFSKSNYRIYDTKLYPHIGRQIVFFGDDVRGQSVLSVYRVDENKMYKVDQFWLTNTEIDNRPSKYAMVEIIEYKNEYYILTMGVYREYNSGIGDSLGNVYLYFMNQKTMKRSGLYKYNKKCNMRTKKVTTMQR